jgi:hypothetical protein
MYIGNTPFQGLVGGGNILDASIEGVDLSTSAIAARLGYTPVDPGAATFTANPTISSGTVNSVPYLNGSKVVTSGNTLTYNGSTFQIGGTSPQLNISVTSGTADTYTYFNNTNYYNYIYFQNNGTTFGSLAGAYGTGMFYNFDTQVWRANSGTEYMRLNSTGLGIGTNSPSGMLHVKGSAGTVYLDGNPSSAVNLRFTSNSGSGWDGIISHGTIGANNVGFTFTVGNTASTRYSHVMDGQGNVGIGTNSPVTLKSKKTLQVLGFAKLGDDNGNGLLSLGDIASTGANVAIWRGAGGAYAGVGNYLNLGGYDGITFTTGNNSIDSQTERARIDSGGHFMVGTATALGGAATFYGSTNTVVIAQGSSSSYAGLRIYNDINSSSRALEIDYYGSTATERAEIFVTGAYPLLFGTNNTERVRITSSGNLSVGNTINNGKIGSSLSDTNTTFSSLGYGMLGLVNTSNTANNYTWMTFNESNANYVGAIGTQNVAHNSASGAVYGDLVFATKTNGLGGFPTEKMRIDSVGQLTFLNSSGFRVQGIKASGFGYSPSSYGALVLGAAVGGGSTTVCIGVDPSGNASGAFTGNGAEVMFRNGVSFQTPNAANTAYHTNILILKDGKIGIGTTAPSAPVHIVGSVNDTLTASSANLKLNGGGGDGIAIGQFTASPYGTWIQSGYLADGYNPPFNSGYPLVLNPAGGNVSIGSNRSPSAKLTIGGAVLLEATAIGNLASNSLGTVPYGISRYSFNLVADNTYRTLVSNINDMHGEFFVFLSDSASGDVARYFISTTSPAYGVQAMSQMQYMDGGWNTGSFDFQYATINNVLALQVKYSSYYSSSNYGYGTIEFRRL